MAIISKRSFILGAGAAFITRPARALIVPRNPFAFPGGRIAGFDPSHPASAGIRYSAVPGSGGTFDSLLTGARATVTTPVKVQTAFGPAGSFAAAAQINSITNPFVETPSFITVAAICAPNAGTYLFVTAPASPNGILIQSATFRFTAGGTIANSGIPATAGHTYFIACSATPTVKTFVAVDLNTGQTYKAVITSGTTFNATGTWNLGGANGVNPWLGTIHAIMYSVGSLTQTQMLTWAKSPWDFWYPPTRDSLMFSGLGNVQPASAGSAQMPLFGVGP